MKLQLIFMEEGDALFAGYGLNCPVLKWDAGSWRSYEDQPKPEGWADRLSEREAERCFPGATVARQASEILEWKEFQPAEAIRLRPDLFDSYDPPYIRKSPDEQQEEREKSIALVRALREGRRLPD